MSSVTRLHLLSQSMLNVSCQKQKRRGSFPADSLTESPMEFMGRPCPSGACTLLDVPGLSSLDPDEDEGEVVIGIRPKSSPLPRRKSSLSDEDSEPEPPTCGSRRVSFADAKGLSLVQVKEFETWEIPALPANDFSEGKDANSDECFLSCLNFSLPLSDDELFIKVRDQKVVLETLQLLPGTTIVKGVVRVLNVSFSKAVYVRTTLDTWANHFDILAEYIPGSSDGQVDRFSFKLTLVPPFGEQGTRVDFCLRYETPVGTFWANNDNGNYVLLCHQGMMETKEKPQRKNLNKRSCLKLVSQNLNVDNGNSAVEASPQENVSAAVAKQGEEVNTVTDKRVEDDRLGTSQEDEQKLRAENRRNRSRRSQRKAARVALLRHRYAQRGGGANDSDGDEPPHEAKQAVEKHLAMQSSAETSSESEGFQVVHESADSCIKALGDVLNETSQAHNSGPEKSEKDSLADSATSRGGESATHSPDKPVHPSEQPAFAEPPDMNPSASEAEGQNQKKEPGPADGVISDTSTDRLSTNSGFAFGTVVAPLYHQVSARMGRETQTVGDGGARVRATLNDGGLTQRYQADTTESRRTVATDATSNNANNAIKAQECLDATPRNPPKGGKDERPRVLQRPAYAIHSDSRCTSSHEVPNAVSGGPETHVHNENMLNMDLSKGPQGEAQEDDVAFDLRAQAAQDEPTEPKCSQTKTNRDAATGQTETEGVTNPMGIKEEKSRIMSTDSTGEGTPNHPHAKGTNIIYVSSFEIVDKKDFTTHETSPETQKETNNTIEQKNLGNYASDDEAELSTDIEAAAEVAESMTKADHTHADVFTEFEDETVVASQKAKHRETEAAAATREEVRPATKMAVTETTEDKGKSGMTDGEESKDKNQEEDTGGETDKEGTDEEPVEEDGDAEEELEYAKATQRETMIGGDEPEVDRTEEQGVTVKKTNVQKEEMETDTRGEAQADPEWEDQVNHRGDDAEDKNRDYEEEMLADAGGETTLDADSQGVTSAATEDGAEREAIAQNEVKDGLSAPVSNVQGPGGGQHVTGDPRAGYDSTSAESDSDDEVELYMHCLRAVHAGTQAQKDRETGPAAGKRPAPSKSKNLSAHMPSISESLDEEQHPGSPEGTSGDMEKLEVQPTAAAPSGGQERAQKPVPWWKETPSCSNVSKTLLCATSLVVFLFVAYHYDFFACFALYLASVVWLCCQGDAPPVKNNKRLN